MHYEPITIQTIIAAAGDIAAWHEAEKLLSGGTPENPIRPSRAELARRLIRIGAEAVCERASVVK